MSLATILIILLAVPLIGAIPGWHGYGYAPAGGIGLVLVVLLILVLLGHI